MKKMAIALVAAFLTSISAPVLAADTAQDKETCAISANTCLDKAKVLEKKIMKLKREIKAGNTYSPEEMKMIEQKLQDAMDQLDKMEGMK